MEKTVKVKVLSLVIDYDIYPRMSVDSQHVGYLVEARSAGKTLPPIVIDKKTKRVVDGVHRCKAEIRLRGDEAEIDAIEKEYASEKELFLDAIRLNAHHGARLDRHDRVHCAILGGQKRIAKSALAEAMHMNLKRFEELVKARTAFAATPKSVRDNGGAKPEPRHIPIKLAVQHMAGKEITASQEEAITKRLGGNQPMFWVNQIILLIEENLIDEENSKLIARMGVLQDVLSKFMDKFAKK